MTSRRNPLRLIRVLILLAASLTALRSDAESCPCAPRHVDYEGDRLPDAEAIGWTPHVDRAARLATSGGALTIDTSHDIASWAYYSRCVEIDFARGVTVEARVKLARTVGTPGMGSAGIWIEDSVGGAVLLLRDREIELYRTSYRYSIDTSTFHVYRIVTRGYQLRVYIDGKLAIDAPDGYRPAFGLSDPNRIMFGDGSSGASASSTWDYVRYELGPVNYRGDELPARAPVPWQSHVSGAADTVVAGGVLSLDTSRDEAARAYYLRCATIDWERGITLSARLKLDRYVGTPDLGGAAISISDKGGGAALLLSMDGIKLYNTSYRADLDTSVFHDYEIVTRGSSIQVYVDDALVIDAPAGYSSSFPRSGDGEIWFGDGSGGASAASSWVSVSYRNN